MSNQNALAKFVVTVARWLDRFRRALHLFFLMLLAMLIVAVLGRQQPMVPAEAALVLNPQGIIVDQLSGEPLERALALAQGIDFGETLLADLIEAVREAQDDRRIKALVR